MTQIHARSHPTCSKETKGYEFVVFCKVVNLMCYIYIHKHKHKQTQKQSSNVWMCLCVSALCDFLKVYMHILDRFQKNKVPLLTLHILRGKHSSFYPFEALCMYCSAHVDPSFDAFFPSPSPRAFLRSALFFPFCHVLWKCQCAEYDVVRVCMTPTLTHTCKHTARIVLSFYPCISRCVYGRIYTYWSDTTRLLLGYQKVNMYARTSHSIHFLSLPSIRPPSPPLLDVYVWNHKWLRDFFFASLCTECVCIPKSLWYQCVCVCVSDYHL